LRDRRARGGPRSQAAVDRGSEAGRQAPLAGDGMGGARERRELDGNAVQRSATVSAPRS